MRVKTVFAHNSLEIDERVNREIARIEGNGGEVVNVSLAACSTRLFFLYATILFSDEVGE